MKIREKYAKEDREVYVIYWAEYQGKQERYHCIIPENGYPGLTSVPESECDLIDAGVRNFVMTKNGVGKDILMHPVLAADNSLYFRLVEHDPGAMEIFLSKMDIG